MRFGKGGSQYLGNLSTGSRALAPGFGSGAGIRPSLHIETADKVRHIAQVLVGLLDIVSDVPHTKGGPGPRYSLAKVEWKTQVDEGVFL